MRERRLPFLVRGAAEADHRVIDVIGADDLYRNCIGRLRYQLEATDAGLIDRLPFVAEQDGFV